MPDRSLVAGVNALFRAVESRAPAEDRILADPYAGRLAEHHAAVWLLRLLRFAVPPLYAAVEAQRIAHCVRHRAVDALVEEAISAGFFQVVILGAGYDTRASRLNVPGMRWFEVDRAPMLRRKAKRLAGLPGVNEGVRAIPADLAEALDLTTLRSVGFDPRAPALFVIEGLLHYLQPARVEALFTEMAAGSGPRRLILSFIDAAMVPQASTTFRAMIRVLGEIPKTFYAPEALTALAAQHGWGKARCWSWAEQAGEFAPQAMGRACGVTQEVGCFDRV